MGKPKIDIDAIVLKVNDLLKQQRDGGACPPHVEQDRYWERRAYQLHEENLFLRHRIDELERQIFEIRKRD